MGTVGTALPPSTRERSAAQATDSATRATNCGEAMGKALPARLKARTTLRTHSDATTLPETSKPTAAAPGALPGRQRPDRNRATTETGRLTTKMTCQESPWATAPPMTGPTTLAIPYMAEAAPRYGPLSLGASIIAAAMNTPASRTPPPTPWSRRNAASASMVGAAAHRTDDAAKSASPATYTLLRPNENASPPHRRVDTVLDTR